MSRRWQGRTPPNTPDPSIRDPYSVPEPPVQDNTPPPPPPQGFTPTVPRGPGWGQQRRGFPLYQPTFGQDPRQIAKAYNQLQTLKPDQQPEWLKVQSDQIKQAYEWFNFRNEGKPWTEWKFLAQDDPAHEFLKSIQGPPPDVGPDQFTFAKNEQALQGTANWQDISPVERANILNDPNFDIAKYPYWQHAQILNDPAWDWEKHVPNPYERFIQQQYFALSSSPGGMGAFNMALMGLPSGPLGVAGMAGLGYLTGEAASAMGYDPAKEWNEQGALLGPGADQGMRTIRTPLYDVLKLVGFKPPETMEISHKSGWDDFVRGAFGLLNLAAETAEKALGFGIQAGAATIGTLDPRVREDFGTLSDIFQHPQETWDAGLVTWERLLPTMTQLMSAMPEQIVEFLKGIPEGKLNLTEEFFNAVMHPSERYLGRAEPLPSKYNFIQTLIEARKRLIAGEDERQVALELQGSITAQMADLVGQGVADPLNVTGRVETETGRAVASLLGDKIAYEAFTQTQNMQGLTNQPGLPTAAKLYQNLVLNPDLARKIDPSFKVDELGWLGRQVAGLTSDYKIKGGVFPSLSGSLMNPAPKRKGLMGWLQNMTSHTPESRARIGFDLLARNMGGIMASFFNGDPTGFTKWFKAFANGDMTVARNVSERLMGAPEFYTVLPAAKGAADKITALYDAAWIVPDPARQEITRLADILGEKNPVSMIEDLYRRGTAEQDFERIKSRLAEKGTPEARALLLEIEAGRFTSANLAEAVQAFGSGEIPYHPGHWMALALDALRVHYDEWAVKHFGLDAEAQKTLFRLSHVLKSMQSILLLGGNPGYMIQNVTNTMTTRAFSGSFGYLTPSAVDTYLTRLGYSPDQGFNVARINEGVGMSGLVGQTPDKITQAVKGKGALTNLESFFGKIARGMPFNKLSRLLEGHEGKQAYVSGIRKFMGETWIREKGFKRIPTRLEAELKRVAGPRGPEILYSMIEAGLNGAEIDRIIYSRDFNVKSRALIVNAANELNIPVSEAARTLEQIGILDALDAQMKGAKTEAQIIAAFQRAKRIAQAMISQQAAQDAIARIEHIANRIEVEGPKAITDIVMDMEMRGIVLDLKHFQRMGEAAELVDNLDSAKQRATVWNMNYAKSRAERVEYNAERGSIYLGIQRALSLDASEPAKEFLTGIADIDKIISESYQKTRELRNEHVNKWNRDWLNSEQFSERTRIESDIEKMWKEALDAELRTLNRMGENLAKQYEALFGIEAGEAARQAWDQISAFRKEMIQRHQDFRKTQNEARQMGVSLKDRQQKAKEFWSETYKFMIVEMARIKQDAITTLDRIARGRGPGDQTPTPAGTTPPPEGGAGPSRLEIEAQEREKLRVAAEERAQAWRDLTNSWWAVLEEVDENGQPIYHHTSRNNTGPYHREILQDRMAILNVLRNPLYGGDPNLPHNINDAIKRFTPEELKQIFDLKMQMHAEAEEQATLANEVRFRVELENVRQKAAKRTDDADITMAKFINTIGGINLKDILNLTGEPKAGDKFRGIFSRDPRRFWSSDQMARMLLDAQYPIDPDDPINSMAALLRSGEYKKTYPIYHEYIKDAEVAKAESEWVEQQILDAAMEQAFDEGQWDADMIDAISAANIDRMTEIFENLPPELSDQQHGVTGETYNEFFIRELEQVKVRLDEEKIAEAEQSAKDAVQEQQNTANIEMTRQLLAEKYAQAFPNVSEAEISAWMEASDAALDSLAKISGETREKLYSHFRDVLKDGDPDLMDMMQGWWFGLGTFDPNEPASKAIPSRVESEIRDLTRMGEIMRVDLSKLSDAIKTAVNEYKWDGRHKPFYTRDTLIKIFDDVFAGTDNHKRMAESLLNALSYLRWYDAYGHLLDLKDISSVNDYRQRNILMQENNGYLPFDPARFKNVGEYLAVLPRYRKGKRGPNGQYIEIVKNPRRQAGYSSGGYRVMEFTRDGNEIRAEYMFSKREAEDTAAQFQNDWYAPDLLQEGRIEPINRRLTQQEIEDYTRALVRAGEDELRRAIQSEPMRGDRIAMLDEAHRLNPSLAEKVATSLMDMLFQDVMTQQKGGVRFVDGRAIINGFSSGDISTIIHENGHVFLEMMREIAKKTGNASLLNDLTAFDAWSILKKDGNTWTAINGKGQFEIRTGSGGYIYKGPSGAPRTFNTFAEAEYVLKHEMFARAFERYFFEGVSPTPKLVPIFKKFKDWLLNIYKSITGSQIDVNLTDEMRDVFDRLMGAERQPISLSGQERRQTAYKTFIEKLPSMDADTKDMMIRWLLQKTMIDNVSGVETVYAKIMAGRIPRGWSAGMLDLNALKAINDTFGHDVGDLVISELGKIAAPIAQANGARIFRTGGDEFTLWFSDPSRAVQVMQAIDEAMFKAVIEFNAGGVTMSKSGFSVSYGIGETEKVADVALYADKEHRIGTGQRSTDRGVLPSSIVDELIKVGEKEFENVPENFLDEVDITAEQFETLREELEMLTGEEYSDEAVETHILAAGQPEPRRVVPPDEWENTLFKARTYAKDLGIADKLESVWNNLEGLTRLIKQHLEELETPTVRGVVLQQQLDAGWNPAWPFIPADLNNADFRDLIRSDPSITDDEKAKIFAAGYKLGVVPKSEIGTGQEGRPIEMFPGGEDLPLLSGSAQTMPTEEFRPPAEQTQESMFDMRPQFGVKPSETEIKIKTDLTRNPQSTSGIGPHVEAPTISAPERERNLLNALLNKLEGGTWFEKGKDFETYIKNAGYDLMKESDLNLAYDIMEGAFNLRAREIRANLDSMGSSLDERLIAMEILEGKLTEARRTLGKMALQQFSTPLTISEAAGWVADVQEGDIVGEPTAGTGNLVDRFMNRTDITLKVNEIDEGRRAVLSLLGYKPTDMNLMRSDWIIENGKKAGPWADVIISNPPWGSYSTGKYGKPVNTPVKLNDWSQRFAYLTMLRLAENGRFIGVMPTNWLYNKDRTTGLITNKPSEFYKWLKNNYTVQAVIESPPGAYKMRATDIGSLLVVVDKTPHALDTLNIIERFGESAPKDWIEYAKLINSVPKRAEEAVHHGHEQFREQPAGPDESGIVDPTAADTRIPANADAIGKPVGAAGSGRPRGPRGNVGPDANAILAGTEQGTIQDTGGKPETSTGDLGAAIPERPAEIPIRNAPENYTDGFRERLQASRVAVRNSESFTEYISRSPLRANEYGHPHPSLIVETKSLSGVPYPKLEEAYRPSPAVMRAMDNHVLSLEGNIDPIWAAVQQNDKYNMGILIADDVGIGKTRTGAGFVMDRIEKGHKKILVVTDKEQNVINLMAEYPQVWSGKADENGAYLTPPPKDYPAQMMYLRGNKFPDIKKGNTPIPAYGDRPLVVFVDRNQFKDFMDPILQWKPETVVIDEAHMFLNAENGKTGPAWVKLHEDWIDRKASMMYLTATPGKDISELSYLYGLKIWRMDGFGDWIGLITGRESPESVKRKQDARKSIDEYLNKLREARSRLGELEWVSVKVRDFEGNGYKVGKIIVVPEADVRSPKERYPGFVIEDKDGKLSGYKTHVKSETEAILLADIMKKYDLASMDAYDIREAVTEALDELESLYPKPDKSEMQSLGIRDSSDAVTDDEKGFFLGRKGLGAWDATIPPAHTEQIMRELKVSGSYLSRDISRNGVEFGIVEARPDPQAKEAHNKRVEIYRRMYQAFIRYGSYNEGPKKFGGMMGLNGPIQADAKRSLFNMRIPGIVKEAQAAISRGEQVVISVLSVGDVDGEEGNLPYAISLINTQEVRKVGDGEYSDPTEIPEALAEVAEIQDALRELPPLLSPVDIFKEIWGDKVEFVIGGIDVKDRIANANAFQRNKLDVIVISEAGKQGINLHDITGKRRVHLIVGDYEWSPSNFKQELGRVDRTGQRSSPKVTVMSSGAASERKFLATISNRMKGIGATSKGGAESTGTTAMEIFELGTALDKMALQHWWMHLGDDDKAMFLDPYFRGKGTGESASTINATSQSFNKFMLGLQQMELDEGNRMLDSYLSIREKWINMQEEVTTEMEAIKTAATTGEINRRMELSDNLRLTEVKNQDGSRYGILEGVLTPHMNAVKQVITGGRASVNSLISGKNDSGWMRWVRFHDKKTNSYVAGLKIGPSFIQTLAEHFGKSVGTAHTLASAWSDLRAGDKIPVVGAEGSEWTLYIGRGGNRDGLIVVDGAKMKHRSSLGGSGAQYSAIGNFFFIPDEDNLKIFLKRFPIRKEAPPPLYQDAPMPVNPRMPLGGYEQASQWRPESEVMREGWSEYIDPLLDSMQIEAVNQFNSPKMEGAYRDMSPEGQADLRRYMEIVKGDLATTKMAATRWGEQVRDFSLLNYKRRFGIDNWADIYYPYQLFYTRSMLTWAMRALENPAILSNYARILRQMNRYENDLPERLRGKIKIPAPWLPEWMGGSLYIDPLSLLFTPHNFVKPFERLAQDQNYQMIEAERILQIWMDDGTISEQDAIQAMKTRAGTIWERAIEEAKLRREAEISNPLDFINTMMGPAWYLNTPYKLLTGRGQELPELPITKTARAAENVTRDTWAEPIGGVLGLFAKPEEMLRGAAGLPQYGEYGDYYVKRMLANLVAEGKYTPEQAQTAMIEKQGPLWDEAAQRVEMELAMRVPLSSSLYAALHNGPLSGAQAFLPSLFGSGLLPEGELKYRGLKDEWDAAWKMRDAGDTQALNKFFDAHPEYEAYIAKSKEPEEMLKTFLIGQVWDGYMTLGETNRKQATKAMDMYTNGLFSSAFLNKETRSYDSVSVDTLTVWARMLNMMAPKVEQTLPAIQEKIPAINLYNPAVAGITDDYFRIRKEKYPNYYMYEQMYYALPKSERAGYLLKFPQYAEFRKWRQDQYDKYPDLIPIFKGQVFKQVDTSSWPPALEEYVARYAFSGQPLPSGARKALEQIWIREGMPLGDFDIWLDTQVAPAIMYKNGVSQ